MEFGFFLVSTRCSGWLRRSATNRKVSDSISDDDTDFSVGAAAAQSVERLATSWTTEGSEFESR
jgi:hypothetical protein